MSNKARTVTELGWFTPLSVLLRQCGWLSINQLVEYHNILLLFKVKIEKKPGISIQYCIKRFPYETNSDRAKNIVENQQTSRDMGWDSFPSQAKPVMECFFTPHKTLK